MFFARAIPADVDFKASDVADACRHAATKNELGDAAVNHVHKAAQFAFRTMPRKVVDNRNNYAAAKDAAAAGTETDAVSPVPAAP